MAVTDSGGVLVCFASSNNLPVSFITQYSMSAPFGVAICHPNVFGTVKGQSLRQFAELSHNSVRFK
jgi:hypothetical protein